MSEQTIKTYTTKKFSHEGTSGSTPLDRLKENGKKGITTQVLEENDTPVIKIVGHPVKVIPTSSGVSEDEGKVKNTKYSKGPSAGHVGGTNVNAV